MGNVTGSASRIAPSAPVRSAMPVSAPVPSSSSSTAAWNVGAVPSPSEAAQTDTAVPSSTSRPCPITPPAPHPISPSGAQDLVHRLEHQLGRPEHARPKRTRPRGRSAASPSSAAAARGGVQRGRARLEQRRKAGADADGHARVTILQRPCKSSPSSGRPVSARPPSPSRSPSACVERGEDPVAVSADAHAGLRRACRSSPGPPTRDEQARLEHRLLGFVPDPRDVLGRRLRPARPRGDRRAARAAAGARSSSAAPACTCAPRWPTSTSDRRWTRRSASADRRA